MIICTEAHQCVTVLLAVVLGIAVTGCAGGPTVAGPTLTTFVLDDALGVYFTADPVTREDGVVHDGRGGVFAEGITYRQASRMLPLAGPDGAVLLDQPQFGPNGKPLRCLAVYEVGEESRQVCTDVPLPTEDGLSGLSRDRRTALLGAAWAQRIVTVGPDGLSVVALPDTMLVCTQADGWTVPLCTKPRVHMGLDPIKDSYVCGREGTACEPRSSFVTPSIGKILPFGPVEHVLETYESQVCIERTDGMETRPIHCVEGCLELLAAFGGPGRGEVYVHEYNGADDNPIRQVSIRDGEVVETREVSANAEFPQVVDGPEGLLLVYNEVYQVGDERRAEVRRLRVGDG